MVKRCDAHPCSYDVSGAGRVILPSYFVTHFKSPAQPGLILSYTLAFFSYYLYVAGTYKEPVSTRGISLRADCLAKPTR